jgi:hypothetical protein
VRRVATVFFGIVVPLACVTVDHGHWIHPRALLLTQVFVVVEVIALALWLLRKRPAALLAGLFAAGSIVAAFVSLFLTLLAGPLLLGFALTANDRTGDALFEGARALLCFATPLTACVYARNAARAWECANNVTATESTTLALCGFLLAFTFPAGAYRFVQHRVDTSFRELYASTSADEREAIDRLRPYRRYVLRREFIAMYHGEEDPARKAKLAAAYRELKGGDIEKADDSASD